MKRIFLNFVLIIGILFVLAPKSNAKVLSATIKVDNKCYVKDTLTLKSSYTTGGLKDLRKKVNVEYSVSDTSMATISGNKIFLKKPGSVVATVKVTQGSTSKTASETITVYNRKFANTGSVSITETTKVFNSKTQPYYNGDYKLLLLNYGDFNVYGVKSNGTNYAEGAVALYMIDGWLTNHAKKDWLVTGTNKDKTYYLKNAGTNFGIIKYKYCESFSTYQSFLQAIYTNIIEGYPVAVKVNPSDSSNSAIYVVAYGVTSTDNSNRKRGKLSPSDILVLDPRDAQKRKLSDYYTWSNNGYYALGIRDLDLMNKANSNVDKMVEYAISFNGKGLSEVKTKLKNDGVYYEGYSGAWCSWFVDTMYRRFGFEGYNFGKNGLAAADAWHIIGTRSDNKRYHSKNSGYIPKKGDLILYDYNNNNVADHVGIITSKDNTNINNIWTVEGNITSKVQFHQLWTGSTTPGVNNIMGYFSVK